MLPHIGVPELILILVLLLIIFGPGKLPQFGKWLGRTIRQVRESGRDTVDGYKEAVSDGDSKDIKRASAAEDVRKDSE